MSQSAPQRASDETTHRTFSAHSPKIDSPQHATSGLALRWPFLANNVARIVQPQPYRIETLFCCCTLEAVFRPDPLALAAIVGLALEDTYAG